MSENQWRVLCRQEFDDWDDAYQAGIEGRPMPSHIGVRYRQAYEFGQADAESVGLTER